MALLLGSERPPCGHAVPLGQAVPAACRCGVLGHEHRVPAEGRLLAVVGGPRRREPLGDEINKLAQDDVATIPLGQFFIRTAYRKSITGPVKGSMPYPWGVRPS